MYYIIKYCFYGIYNFIPQPNTQNTQGIRQTYSNTRIINRNQLFISMLQHSLKTVNQIFQRFCKLYGRKFPIFKGESQMQTVIQGQKLAILRLTLAFGIVNDRAFSKQNNRLVKYQFCFSVCSTRFPCDFTQPTLFQVDFPQFEQLQHNQHISSN